MIEIRHLVPNVFGDPILEVRIARTMPVYPPSLKWILGAFAVLCLGVALTFAWHGAYPVFGFAGLEIVLLILLLRVSLRRTAIEEAVSLCADTTVVARDGAEQAWLQSYWLRVEDDPYSSTRGLTLRSGAQKIAVGAGLGAQELSELHYALREGLARLKSVPGAPQIV